MEMLRRNPLLSREEYEFLRTNTTQTKEIGMIAGRGVTVHQGKEVAESVGLQGASPNISVITNLEAEDGRFVSEVENRQRMNVAFIGHDLKDKFFPGTSAIGQSLVIEGMSFQVVGVSKVKGSVFGQSQDNFLMIPIETYFKIWGARNGMTYAATAIDHAHLLQAQEESRMLLRAYRHLGPREDDSFGMVTSDALLSFWSQLTQ